MRSWFEAQLRPIKDSISEDWCSQPDWRSAEPVRALGRPNLLWGVTGGNRDSMVNRYTSDRKVRSDDAYVRLMRRLLFADDVPLRLPPAAVPFWLRPGGATRAATVGMSLAADLASLLKNSYLPKRR